jgi:hypothetical protein
LANSVRSTLCLWETAGTNTFLIIYFSSSYILMSDELGAKLRQVLQLGYATHHARE